MTESTKRTIAIRFVVAASLAVLAMPLYATGTPQPEPVKASSDANAAAQAGAMAGAVGIGHGGNALSVSEGGNAVATGGIAHGGTSSATQQQSATSGATASNAGNSQSITYRQVRQAPSVGQGSLMIGACGAGGNAGGSNTGGSAFLGFAFITPQCYDFMLAQAYLSMGAYQAACEVLATSKVGKRAAKRGVSAPECAPPEPAVVTTQSPQPIVVNVSGSSVDTSELATKEYVNEVWKRSMSK